MILALAAIILLVALVFGFKALISLFDGEDRKDDEVLPAKEGLNIEINDYKVYFDDKDELGFDFVVADMSFSDRKAFSYDLANMMTDEGLKLNDIFAYQKKLDINSYDFSALGTTTDISSEPGVFRCKVFVPLSQKRNLLTLTEGQSGKTFAIDLTKNHADIMDLKRSSTPSEIRTSDYDIDVSDNYISTMMTHQGEEYDCSMLSVYTFRLKVVAVKEGISIESAVFDQTSTGEKWDALDASYSSYKIDNIIGKTLSVGDEYALFFEVYSNADEKPEYEGKITLTFSDGSKAVIDAKLN